MKQGFIQPNKSAAELMRLFKQFEAFDVLVNDIAINLPFDEFLKRVDSGDVVVVDSYAEVFGSLSGMLSCLIELFERGIMVESCHERSLCLDAKSVEILKTILSVGNKVMAHKTQEGLHKARLNGVKLGRPVGTLKVSAKVAQVANLCRTQGLSVSKACKEVGCNPRTYYRYVQKV